MIPFAAGASLSDLLDGQAVAEVFSPAERRLCGSPRILAPWAGRLAAKRAVLSVIGGSETSRLAPLLGPGGPAMLTHDDAATGLTLASVEILPSRDGLCDPGQPCHRSHRPTVILGRTAGHRRPMDHRLDVSISHTATMAVALAVALPSRSGPGTEARDAQ